MSKKSMRRLESLDRKRTSKMTLVRVDMIVMLILIIGISIGGVFAYNYFFANSSGTLKTLEGYVDRFGNFVDPRGEIGVNSADDVGYKLSPTGELSIVYGRAQINLGKSVTAEQVKQLKRIGLTIERNGDKDYNVYYRGTKVKKRTNSIG